MVVRMQLRKTSGLHYIMMEEDLTHPMVRPIYVTLRFRLIIFFAGSNWVCRLPPPAPRSNLSQAWLPSLESGRVCLQDCRVELGSPGWYR